MNLYLMAVGTKMPSWVTQAYEDYAKRFHQDLRVQLKEVPAEKRSKTVNADTIKQREGERLLSALPKSCRVVAMEVGGKPWSTEQLAEQLALWMQEGQDVALMIGGPDGLSDACRIRADQQWSLSPLTLPHPLVRVVMIEQLYRAWSILHNHPYHRGEA